MFPGKTGNFFLMWFSYKLNPAGLSGIELELLIDFWGTV